MTTSATPLKPIVVDKAPVAAAQPISAASGSSHLATSPSGSRHVLSAHSPSAKMDAVTAAAASGALPAANGLPDDPVEASSVSRLFPHPPAPDFTPSSTPAPLTATSASIPASPHPVSPPRTPAAAVSLRSAVSPSSLLGSPASERANPLSQSSALPAHLVHSLHQHQNYHPVRNSTDALPTQSHPNSPGLRSPVRTRQHGAASSIGTSPPGMTTSHSVPWHQADLHAPNTPHTPHTPRTPHSPSIFERDIEHRDASHIMTKQEAMDVAIPSVLDDAVEAIIEDDAEIEVVAPQNPAPPLALSSAALSAHSGASSPSFDLASSPSPPLSASGALEAPPGTMAAQIAEKLGTRAMAADDPSSTPRRAAAGGPRHFGSDVDSAGNSMRSRSPPGSRMLDLAGGDGGSPVRSRASVSPAPGLTPVSLAAAVSQTQATSPVPVSAAGGHSPMPTATAFPSLPLPNPYRSSSPNLSAMALPSLTAGVEAGRPATSSLSIDGAIISGTEVATLDHSLDTIADVIAAHDAEQAVSPYVPRSPAPPSISGTSSPHVGGSAIRPPQQHPGMGAAAGANRAAAPGTLGLPPSTSGLGVMGTGESLFAALASGSPSPSADKRRLSFFSYADILNENKGEVMDLQGVVRHAAERDEQQHGLFHPQAHAAHSQEASNGYEAFSLQPSIMQQLGGASMARSASTSAAANPRTSSMPGGVRSASGSSSVAGGGGTAGSGAYTPARGRRENHLENKALSNRLDSLHLATSNAATVAAEAKMRRAA